MKYDRIIRILMPWRKVSPEPFRPGPLFWVSHIGWIYLAAGLAETLGFRGYSGGAWPDPLLYFSAWGFVGCVGESLLWWFLTCVSSRDNDLWRNLAIRATVPVLYMILFGLLAPPLNQTH